MRSHEDAHPENVPVMHVIDGVQRSVMKISTSVKRQPVVPDLADGLYPTRLHWSERRKGLPTGWRLSSQLMGVYVIPPLLR